MTTRRRSPRKKANSPGKGGSGRLSTDLRIILLDQEPLRRAAASECSKALARLDQAKAKWRRFESEDKVAFDRWMAATFGALLSEIREVEQQLREKESLVGEVEIEVIFGGANGYRAAYKRVIESRNRPPSQPEERASAPPRDEDEDMDEEFGDLDEYEQMMMFEEFVRTALGQNPDLLSDDVYETAFAEFRAHVFGQQKTQPDSPPAAVPSRPPQPEDGRIKELYRLLVRRLHPDTRADSDSEVSALWHEVQEAYSKGNLERLEMLLALTDLQSNGTGEQTSLSQMRSVLAELRRAYNALQKNLKAAQKDRAWGFASMPKRDKLEQRIRKQLQSDLSFVRMQLKELNRLIASWEAQPTRRKKPPQKKKQSAAKQPEQKKRPAAAKPPQMDFFF